MRSDERKSEQQRLQELTRRNVQGLISSELKLSLTMTELAETEAALGDHPHAQALLEKVEQAMDSVRHHVGDQRLSEAGRNEIRQKMHELEKRFRAAVKRIDKSVPKST